MYINVGIAYQITTVQNYTTHFNASSCTQQREKSRISLINRPPGVRTPNSKSLTEALDSTEPDVTDVGVNTSSYPHLYV